MNRNPNTLKLLKLIKPESGARCRKRVRYALRLDNFISIKTNWMYQAEAKL